MCVIPWIWCPFMWEPLSPRRNFSHLTHFPWISLFMFMHFIAFCAFWSTCGFSLAINGIKYKHHSYFDTHEWYSVASVCHAYLMMFYGSYQHAFETLHFIDFVRVLFNFLLFHHFIGHDSLLAWINDDAVDVKGLKIHDWGSINILKVSQEFCGLFGNFKWKG